MMLAKMAIEPIENFHLGCGDTLIFDQLCRARCAQLRLKPRCADTRLRGLTFQKIGHGFNIQIKDIEK